MSDPARKENRRIGLTKIGGTKFQTIAMKIASHMVNSHDNDNNPPQQIDRFNALRIGQIQSGLGTRR